MYMEKDKTTVIHNLTGTAQYVFFEKDFYKHISGGKSKWEGRQQQAMQPKIHWAWRMQAGNMIGDCPLLIVKKEVLK